MCQKLHRNATNVNDLLKKNPQKLHHLIYSWDSTKTMNKFGKINCIFNVFQVTCPSPITFWPTYWTQPLLKTRLDSEQWKWQCDFHLFITPFPFFDSSCWPPELHTQANLKKLHENVEDINTKWNIFRCKRLKGGPVSATMIVAHWQHYARLIPMYADTLEIIGKNTSLSNFSHLWIEIHDFECRSNDNAIRNVWISI